MEDNKTDEGSMTEDERKALRGIAAQRDESKAAELREAKKAEAEKVNPYPNNLRD